MGHRPEQHSNEWLKQSVDICSGLYYRRIFLFICKSFNYLALSYMLLWQQFYKLYYTCSSYSDIKNCSLKYSFAWWCPR
jgi:hypothetical protein